MSTDILSDKERTLICLAASVASGCRPCTAYHLKSARAVGVCERSIRFAVETALTGRSSATTAISAWAQGCQGSRPEVDSEFRASKHVLEELMSIATAVAVNSVPDFEQHLVAARESRATLEQIVSAIEIGRQIQQVAREKVDVKVKRLTQDVSLRAPAAPTTSCCKPKDAIVETGLVHEPAAGCSCE